MTQPSVIQLENRSCTLIVGNPGRPGTGIQISNIGLQQGLDIWFQVRRSLKAKEPNTCDLRIRNLSNASRKALESATTGTVTAITNAPSTTNASSPSVPVQLQAGYVGGTSVIFSGQLRSAQTSTDGPDTVTELSTGDGDQAMGLARSTGSFGVGSNPYIIATALLNDMGIGVGNIATVASILKAGKMFSGGVVLKGSSLDHLVDLAAGCTPQLEVTVQNGVAQWTQLGQPTGGSAYLLTSNTGLTGSPAIDTKGVLTMQTLLLPGLKPGSPIQVNAKYVQGLFRIVSIETTGDTAGDEWGHQIEAKPYGLGAT